MRKNLLWISLIALLILSVLSGLSVNTIKVSAGDYPAIYIDPANIEDPNLTENDTFTVYVKTDYTGGNVSGWQFKLKYDPRVLHGVNVKNGTLIPTGPVAGRTPEYFMSQGVFDPAYWNLAEGKFEAGMFDNNAGELSLTAGYFDRDYAPMPVVSGPGILANVTFKVVGIGATNITISPETVLFTYSNVTSGTDEKGNPNLYGGWGDPYEQIDAYTMPDHIQHGYFINVQNIHDVAVVSLAAPSTATVEQPVPIEVTVVNEGNYTESVTVTVYRNTTQIDNTNFNLARGLFKTVSFTWSTTGLSAVMYMLNATATITVTDQDLSDNNKTRTITLQNVHDVAVVSLLAPYNAGVGEPVPIEVTVLNKGSYDETVTVTVYYATTVIDDTTFTLAKGPTNQTVSFTWSTTGLSAVMYMLNATATITVTDQDLSDNNKTRTITLAEGDVAVTTVVPEKNVVYPTWTIDITVTVMNNGTTRANFTVTAYYNASGWHQIGTPQNVINLYPTVQKNLTFSWSLSGVPVCNRTVKANATIIVPTVETNTADNEAYSWVKVKRLGDVNGDGTTNVVDIILCCINMGSAPPKPIQCDINGDGTVNVVDIILCCINMGSTPCV